jgi:hypothetical protein
MARCQHGPALARGGKIEAAKSFRQLKAWKRLPALKAALNGIQPRPLSTGIKLRKLITKERQLTELQ